MDGVLDVLSLNTSAYNLIWSIYFITDQLNPRWNPQSLPTLSKNAITSIFFDGEKLKHETQLKTKIQSYMIVLINILPFDQLSLLLLLYEQLADAHNVSFNVCLNLPLCLDHTWHHPHSCSSGMIMSCWVPMSISCRSRRSFFYLNLSKIFHLKYCN